MNGKSFRKYLPNEEVKAKDRKVGVSKYLSEEVKVRLRNQAED